MDTTWIVVGDNTRTRIFEMHQAEELTEIEDFVNTSDQLQDKDLRTDGKGRFFGKGERQQGHTAEPNVTPDEHETELFAREVSRFLNDGRNHHRYTKLQLIAQPKFLGLLRHTLDDEVRKLVVNEVSKDLTTANAGEIQQYIAGNLH